MTPSTLDLSPEALAVIEKVKKLLALANNNDNEHQAAAATAKAMELLAAYNLDMAVATSTTKQGPAARSDNKRKGGLYQWQRDLWQAVAGLNFCMYWSYKGLTKGSTYEHRVLGSKANVVGTEVMADYLQQTIERLAQEWAKSQGLNVFCKAAIAYREGMADRLVDRLNAIRWERRREEERKAREAAKANPEQTPGLVLMDVIESEEDANNDYLWGYEPGTSARRRAEYRARQAKAQAEADAKLAEQRAWDEAHPEEAAARKAAEEKARREQYEKWDKEYEARQRRQQARPRKLTPAEERRRMAEFSEGREKANEIRLDKQVDSGASTPRLQ